MSAPQGEPGGVVLPAWAVEMLREHLRRVRDREATAEERDRACSQLSGALGFLLGERAGGER